MWYIVKPCIYNVYSVLRTFTLGTLAQQKIITVEYILDPKLKMPGSSYMY